MLICRNHFIVGILRKQFVWNVISLEKEFIAFHVYNKTLTIKSRFYSYLLLFHSKYKFLFWSFLTSESHSFHLLIDSQKKSEFTIFISSRSCLFCFKIFQVFVLISIIANTLRWRSWAFKECTWSVVLNEICMSSWFRYKILEIDWSVCIWIHTVCKIKFQENVQLFLNDIIGCKQAWRTQMDLYIPEAKWWRITGKISTNKRTTQK